MKVSSLYRYPLKGFSPEKLTSVDLVAGEGFPLDRKFALLRTETAFHAAKPAWLPKAKFVMLMLHERIAALDARFHAQDETLWIRTPDGRDFAFALSAAGGREALERFVLDFLPNRLAKAPKLLHAEGHQFTDKAEKYVSLINLASVRELEKRWGENLDPLRFRANVYIDDAEPFAELGWIGREIRLGHACAEVAQRNGRCGATNVNPRTGIRDRDVPGKLRAEFGHKDLGVYLRITQAGPLSPGDEVEIEPTLGSGNSRQAATAIEHEGKLTCSACYYLFDPRALDAAWTTAKDLPETYQCPDCGAGRDAVSPATDDSRT